MSNKPVDLTKPVETEDGRAARIICTNRKTAHSQLSVLALITQVNSEFVEFYTEEGKTHTNDEFSNLDLINVPVKRKGWVNVYKHIVPCGFDFGRVYRTHGEACRNISRFKAEFLLATIPIEFEEGEGLDGT